ncbi:S-adenosyl-L-methionine-dependent methyltransferase [Rozella allomycis CSF55]|uniref:tRNA (cytosine(38)-C(5))-methyltransferase n=1 Tax=Rozella allomycis (strain CSF55) TaxID=988480 RepID=A0A075B061_ROZAC|nr:DNA methylase, C-5 cytosine-specific domain-containing protein [Rozella allomycis CSF55]RKP20308.1 S-adenosyl-L-methionine-dependent methyltransferase [Rozella allomycis CSF55]|eukprot:EPZ34169.1 DNA methylase, C-5 cytosine-specific domain-containing protein [Rozella allomycis CSF55]
MRVLELFAGVGGMKIAYQMAFSDDKESTFEPIEILPAAITVYNTHSISKHRAKNIIGLKIHDVDNFDMWTMSPPCQPYTKQKSSKELDLDDKRSDCFMHLLTLLRGVSKRPTYIIVENVAPFYVRNGQGRMELLKVLKDLNYNISEYIINPKDSLNIPNSRNRYYLLARLNKTFDNEILQTNLPESKLKMEYSAFVRDYLLKNVPQECEITLSTKCKRGSLFDIVDLNSTSTMCFTKNYTKYAEGTGSVLKTSDQDIAAIFENHCVRKCEGDENCCLKQVGLRYFAPKEIANLMGFPDWFDFPASTTMKEQYRMIGNSINVSVVSSLIKHLLS